MALSLFNRRKTDNPEMTFVDHLEELRWHIMRSLIAVIVGAIVIFINIDWVFTKVIAGPLQDDFLTYSALCKFSQWIGAGDTLCLPPPKVKELQVIAFGSQFMTSISIAFVGGFIIAFPYIFWEFWRFVKPALSPKELKSTRGAIFFVSIFFFLGVAFGYYLLAPFTFSFLANYTIGLNNILVTKPTLSDYMENLVDIIIGSALAFQLPVVSYVLTRIGLITPSFLKTYRKYAYVAILVIAAIITPSPDWMSQMIVFLPLAFLYEFSIIISVRVFKRQQEKDKNW
ncbi:twin-arginine translocase subunit TatC [Paraflavitalea sp. CAU 1676]|uniref:twin-arginine translocase subunit TatC n=1 Tax=Paraflavitalea sp. CAU 1676 TaxID=3032598 RepID=UPI0023DA7043|nr:twin-arginine translocase subunit TatC [Paraflavitalea sp. CAU 1676]MDF2190795.1 twin-arginine translocase subunit TatC [Paraflavitalea sp. CAU 1676]